MEVKNATLLPTAVSVVSVELATTVMPVPNGRAVTNPSNFAVVLVATGRMAIVDAGKAPSAGTEAASNSMA